MEKGKLTYHLLHINDFARLVLIEPSPGIYIWTEMYLAPSLRNGVISKELIRYGLNTFSGTHHVHWLTSLRAFRELSVELTWNLVGPSTLFHACNHSIASSLNSTTALHPLLTKLVVHAISKTRPPALRYYSPYDEALILQRIRRQFVHHHRSGGQGARYPALEVVQ